MLLSTMGLGGSYSFGRDAISSLKPLTFVFFALSDQEMASWGKFELIIGGLSHK